MLSEWCVVVQTHADYEQRLQEEVNARLLKEQELQHLVHDPTPCLPCVSLFTWCVCDAAVIFVKLCAPLMVDITMFPTQADLLQDLALPVTHSCQWCT